MNSRLKHYFENVCMPLINVALSGCRMHEMMKVCHLNLRLENVMIVGTGSAFISYESGAIKLIPELAVKICDFSLAEKFEEEKGFDCYKVGYKDTYVYSSPKRYQEEHHNAAKEDVWSFGVILYKLLTNQFLYELPNENDDKIGGYIALTENNLKQFIISSKLKNRFTLTWFQLLVKMLCINEDQRWTTRQIMEHKLFETYYRKYQNRIQRKNMVQRKSNEKTGANKTHYLIHSK